MLVADYEHDYDIGRFLHRGIIWLAHVTMGPLYWSGSAHSRTLFLVPCYDHYEFFKNITWVCSTSGGLSNAYTDMA
jgi:hypothetical protein